MNTCLVKLTLISSFALVAAQASAQPDAHRDKAPAKTAAPAQANLQKPAVANAGATVHKVVPAPATMTVAATPGANARTASSTAARTTVTAAGSVIVLADGIVANAASAQIQPPAPGFVYER